MALFNDDKEAAMRATPEEIKIMLREKLSLWESRPRINSSAHRTWLDKALEVTSLLKIAYWYALILSRADEDVLDAHFHDLKYVVEGLKIYTGFQKKVVDINTIIDYVKQYCYRVFENDEVMRFIISKLAEGIPEKDIPALNTFLDQHISQIQIMCNDMDEEVEIRDVTRPIRRVLKGIRWAMRRYRNMMAMNLFPRPPRCITWDSFD